MKRISILSLCLLFLVAGCGGNSSAQLESLQKTNEDLTRRVKALEDNLLEADKKLIQHQQALQAMHERLRDMENAVNKISLGPAR
jgi:TolA-binding protein